MSLEFRDARAQDLPAIIALLVDDELGRTRDGADASPRYARAFAEIEHDPNNREFVAELDGRIVGCMQLTIIPGLSRKGAKRGLIEAVRVASNLRGQRIGEALTHHAIEEARKAGCELLQLTSDKSRPRAHAFYARLGFVNSHEGFKLEL